MNPLTLRLRTTLLARTLPSGNVLMAPVSALGLASLGAAGHAADEQQLFLAEHLARAAPEEVARFHLPEGARLVETEVVVPREDLPRRLKLRTPLRVHAVAVPDARGAWVTVAPLDHTFYVPSEEPVDKAVRDEVVRMAGARELTALQYLQLLPPARAELVPLELAVERSERLPPGRVASLRKALRDREKRAWAREVLASVAAPLHERLPREAAALAGRDAELRTLAGLLDGPRRRSALVTGPSLAGKTALVHAWLRARLAKGEAQAWATSGSQLIAGMSGLGQWEERVRRVMEAAEALDAVLFFDNLADLLTERAQGHADIASAMKPWLEEGRVRVVGELRADLVDPAERLHGAFLACMARVRVEALDAPRAREALRLRVEHDRAREPERPHPTPAALDAVVDLAERYQPYESFPGKALRLYDDLRAVADARRSHFDRRVGHLGPDDVHAFFSLRSGIPLFLLREDTALRLSDVERSLGERVVGQREAVRRVAETVCVVKARLQPGAKPLATLLFVGPTGVGKTELARGLAALLFGAEERMVRFDMSEFTDLEAADRLVRGTHGAEGLLTRRVREQPFGVVLLDEIEKAHPSVFDLLLQVCGEARLTDGRGRTAYFHNTILIMTSNLGVASLREAAGFSAARGDAASHYQRAVERHFRPEFVNRIDRVVDFAPLTPEELLRVARIALSRIAARRGFASAGTSLRVGDRALELLAREAHSPRYGARALRRHLEDHLVAPVARALCALQSPGGRLHVAVTAEGDPRDPPPGASLVSTSQSGALTVAVHADRASETREAASSFDRITSARRVVERAMAWPRVESLREQIDFLVLQLDHGRAAGGTAASRATADMASLRSEHHRLAACWGALERDLDEIRTAEELALESFFDDRVPDELVAETARISERFDHDVALALLAQEPRRDEATLMVTELDGLRAMERWLVPLLASCERRGWDARVHLDGEAPRDDEDWPRDRRWGPARGAAEAAERIASPERRFRNALVRVRGPWAGALLAMEAGVHAWPEGGYGDDDRTAALDVQLLGMRASVGDKQWSHPALVPATPDTYAERRRATRVREHAVNGWVRVGGGGWAGPVTSPAAYFDALERVVARDLSTYETNDTLSREERFLGPLDEPPAEAR